MASIGVHEVLNWLSNLFSFTRTDMATEALYDAVMQRSLDKQLYLSKLASDNFEGRFETVTLHTVLVLRRLRQFGAPGNAFADKLYRKVFDGFDHALRERGAGDSSIARKIRGYGERFFGLARAVDAAFEASEPQDALETVLSRNAVSEGKTADLAAYLVGCDEHLSSMSLEAFRNADGIWPKIGN